MRHAMHRSIFIASNLPVSCINHYFSKYGAPFDRHWSDPYDYSYGTHGTPTTFTLGDQLAQLEGGQFCLLAPSGLSAINLVNSTFLSQGDEVWVPDNVYGPNIEHLKIYNSVTVFMCESIIRLTQTASYPAQQPSSFGLKQQARLRLSFQI